MKENPGPAASTFVLEHLDEHFLWLYGNAILSYNRPICFGFGPLVAGFFGVEAVWEDILQQTRDSECHFQNVAKYLGQLHIQAIYISIIFGPI